MFNFVNLTGKRISIVISNESKLSKIDVKNANSKLRQEFKFEIETCCKLLGKYDSKNDDVIDKTTEELKSVINLLLQSYSDEQLKDAQLYLSF